MMKIKLFNGQQKLFTDKWEYLSFVFLVAASIAFIFMILDFAHSKNMDGIGDISLVILNIIISRFCWRKRKK